MQFHRLAWPVYIFTGEGPGKVFARFATHKEAEEFCTSWQAHDPANLYAISEEPD
jgi:hypothetical protein